MSQDPPTNDYKINKERVDFEFLRNKFKAKNLEVKNSFNSKFPHVEKFFSDRDITLGKIRHHSAKVIASGALTSTLLFSPPLIDISMSTPPKLVRSLDYAADSSITNPIPLNQLLTKQMRNYLPDQIGPLTRSQEKNLERIFQDILDTPARATLEGEHLNTTYGYIGAEQHLTRYPGDSVSTHELTPDDEGMAPGRGAWGYFARSKAELTEADIQNEKWYAVVQTLYLDDWSSRLRYLRDWYKYRKVLIVNTINGNAVIADIADSGPAAFTGKHFGGSPEVMNYLGGSRYKKGPVIVFFVDDPENKIPLGPIEYNNIKQEGVAFVQL